MKRTKIYKHHYDYHKFDTNIPEYVDYIVNVSRKKMETISNIIVDFINYADSVKDMKISYPMMYKYLYDNGYNIYDIKNYYNMIRDLLYEHNKYFDSNEYVQHQIETKTIHNMIQDKKSWLNAEKMADTFGTVIIENDNKDKYVLYKAERKDKYKK